MQSFVRKIFYRPIYLSIGLCCMLSLTGCASIVDGEHQTVSVTTPPGQHASCTLSNPKGKWYVSNTPGSVSIHESGEPLTISCHETGYQPDTIAVNPDMRGMFAGNLLFGGIIGGAVDLIDGAAFDYPNQIKVPLKPLPTELAQKITPPQSKQG